MSLSPNFDTVDFIKTGKNLSRLMNSHGVTIKMLADYLDISETAIKKWRSGKNCPTTEHLIKISSLLDIDARQIIAMQKCND